MIIESEHYSLVDKGLWMWKNFTPKELSCRGNGELLIDTILLDKLEKLREICGYPLVINSAYRSPLYNAKIGGAPLSQHKFGRAVDISVRTMKDKNKFIETAKKIGFTGIGIAKSFVHIDIRPSAHIVTWKY